MDQRTYQSAEDFVLDESFGDYVTGRNPEAVAYWQQWLAEHPHLLAVADEAASLVQALQFAPVEAPAPLVDAEAAKFLANTKAVPMPARRRVVRWAAAVALLIVGGGTAWWVGNPLEVRHQTDYGQTKQVQLPDGSLVTLNANSELAYRRGWEKGQDREVQLQGEAFFDVAHRPAVGGPKFVVRAAGVRVEVLGTQFNVFNRHESVKVSLNRGKIRLQLAQADGTKALDMAPGQMVEVTKANQVVTPVPVDAEKLSSWRRQKLTLDNVTLAEVAGMITENYGYGVVFADPALARRRLSGTISLENETVLLQSLAMLLDVEINKNNDNQLVFKTNPNK
jgi:ferric-dicitrate binding protein FerR (iron transport regulator)